jgi:hypothetical protein
MADINPALWILRFSSFLSVAVYAHHSSGNCFSAMARSSKPFVKIPINSADAAVVLPVALEVTTGNVPRALALENERREQMVALRQDDLYRQRIDVPASLLRTQ